MKKLIAVAALAASSFAANAQDMVDWGAHPVTPQQSNTTEGCAISQDFQNCLNAVGVLYIAGMLTMAGLAYRNRKQEIKP